VMDNAQQFVSLGFNSTADDSHFLRDLACPALQSGRCFGPLMMEDILMNNIMSSSVSTHQPRPPFHGPPPGYPDTIIHYSTSHALCP
jgi:hypothetical protein